MERRSQLPPFPVIERALREATEFLAAELRTPSTRAPDWDAFQWDMARAVAAMQGMTVLLARNLKWRGPDRWQEFLDEQVKQGEMRDLRVDDLLTRLDAGVKKTGIAVTALKGSSLRRLGLYSPGERPQGDIDLLAKPEDFQALERALETLGFHHSYTASRHVVYDDSRPTRPSGLGEHLDNPLHIEVHDHIAEKLPDSTVDITTGLLPRDASPGLHEYPDHSALLAHLLLHAAGNMRAHALRLIQLEDIARLVARIGAEAWPRLSGERDAATVAWWALPPLLLAQRYCAAPVPQDVLDRLRAACPPALRRAADRYTLTEVSWSNLRISAFPGVEWSRNLAETLRYVKSRVLPGAQARLEIESAVIVLPQLASVPWYGLSHRSRIVRWVFGRPPRVQAMNSVMAALGRQARQQ